MLSMLMSINLKIYADIDMNIIYLGILITIVITAVVGFIGYKFGKEFITVDFDKYLRWALVALIVASFGGIFVNNPNYWYFITIASLIIFSLLLLSYNNTIRKNAETCKIPNYPDESFGLIIKIVNILQDVMYLLARNRRLRGSR